MNKRQRKKKLKNIFNDIKVLKLKEGDLLVFRVDTTKVPYPLVARYIEHIREKITTNIVVIPTKTDLYIQNNSVTRTLMDYIEKRGQEIAKLKEELAKLLILHCERCEYPAECPRCGWHLVTKQLIKCEYCNGGTESHAFMCDNCKDGYIKATK